MSTRKKNFYYFYKVKMLLEANLGVVTTVLQSMAEVEFNHGGVLGNLMYFHLYLLTRLRDRLTVFGQQYSPFNRDVQAWWQRCAKGSTAAQISSYT